jgi:hypothetical protein
VADDGVHSGREGADELLALALAQGQTVRDAAATAGIAERTAHRRQVDPDFRRRVSQLRDEMIGRAVGILAETMSTGATRLKELVASKNETVALGAVRLLLEMPCKLRDSVELMDKVNELESQLVEIYRATRQDTGDDDDDSDIPDEAS